MNSYCTTCFGFSDGGNSRKKEDRAFTLLKITSRERNKSDTCGKVILTSTAMEFYI